VLYSRRHHVSQKNLSKGIEVSGADRKAWCALTNYNVPVFLNVD
jgi:hypothetical protein